MQLKQVVLNLVVNGIEAMSSVEDRPRELFIRSHRHRADEVVVSVGDSGIGFDSKSGASCSTLLHHSGMGMGLSVPPPHQRRVDAARRPP